VGKHDAMNALIRRPKPTYALASDGTGRAKFVLSETTDPDNVVADEQRRVVDGTSDGGKGRSQEPEPRVGANSEMNTILRREAFITEARRIRQQGR
jgi:hypothetical protein